MSEQCTKCEANETMTKFWKSKYEQVNIGYEELVRSKNDDNENRMFVVTTLTDAIKEISNKLLGIDDVY